jgi:hypothetical protein
MGFELFSSQSEAQLDSKIRGAKGGDEGLE